MTTKKGLIRLVAASSESYARNSTQSPEGLQAPPFYAKAQDTQIVIHSAPTEMRKERSNRPARFQCLYMDAYAVSALLLGIDTPLYVRFLSNADFRITPLLQGVISVPAMKTS